MKKTILLLISLLLIIISLEFFQPGQQVYMAPHVKYYLSEISENYPNETVACLTYVPIGEDIFILHYNMPKTSSATKKSVYSAQCARGEVPYHNHPHQGIRTNIDLRDYYLEETGDTLRNPSQMLYMSPADMEGAYLSGYPYSFVGADGEYAWWSRDQIIDALWERKKLLKAIEGQSTL